MVLVVFLHVSLWADTAFGPSTWKSVSLFLIPFRIPVFFVVSGILAAGSVMHNRPKAMRRALNIYFVYLVWTTVVTLRLHATPDPSDDPNLIAYFTNALVPGHYWYLWALPVYYGASMIMRRIHGNMWLWLPVAFGLYVFAAPLADFMAGVFSQPAEVPYWAKTISCFWWFFLGLCAAGSLVAFGGGTIGRPALQWLNRPPGRAALALFAVAGIAVLSVYRVDLAGMREMAVTFCYIAIAFTAFPALAGTGPERVLAMIGRNTLPVYIFHKLILIVIMAAESRIRLPATVSSIPVDVIVTVLAVALIVLSIGIGRLVKASPFAFLLNGIFQPRGSSSKTVSA
ncbi:acyltransferase family protein [Paenirhodobacter populi]|nr:acyltransferase [Sinirhodobacter populi]